MKRRAPIARSRTRIKAISDKTRKKREAAGLSVYSTGKPKKPTKAKKRSPEEFARIHGSKARVEWVNAQPSVASGRTPCENHHVETGGTGYKAHYTTIVPLTFHEHRVELHNWGVDTFERHYGISLKEKAASTEADWQTHLASKTQ